MAYARWSTECDVYVFARIGGGFECHGCSLQPRAIFASKALLVHHLADHLLNSEKVPGWLFANLLDGGYVDSQLLDLIKAARADGGKVATYDADVPEELRLTLQELDQIAIEMMQAKTVKDMLPEGWMTSPAMIEEVERHRRLRKKDNVD